MYLYADRMSRSIGYFVTAPGRPSCRQIIPFGQSASWLIPTCPVADVYRQRWQVELFFKLIKQHLRIKLFYGTSANAVKIQMLVAVIVYLLVAIAKKQLDLPGSLHTILQIREMMAEPD
ncbi:MAG: hypothetical protein A2052_03080 [Deltaproteobacteria bacterium GWA2_54_12]|nr:MAG: hypothetical protein A2052_03080 [Deltaproteobacteria bacterium GWA2_54_12]